MNARTILASVLLIGLASSGRPASAADVRLDSIYSQCGRMLRFQREIQKAAAEYRRSRAMRPGQGLTPAERAQFRAIAARQKRVIDEANTVIAHLEKDGTAVAFIEVFTELRGQMKKLESRFQKGELDDKTRRLEKEIIDTLQEIIDATRNSHDA